MKGACPPFACDKPCFRRVEIFGSTGLPSPIVSNICHFITFDLECNNQAKMMTSSCPGFWRKGRMARPREFEEMTIVDAAIQSFWSRGYEVTSVRDLAEKMGITGASLYNAFGDKHALYRRVWIIVSNRASAIASGALRGFPPREAIGAFFNKIIERSLGDT